jgi:dTDP-4-amino-4,6-dideoxyglucose formyltransferase
VKKIVLLINGNLGLSILEFVAQQSEVRVIGVVINSLSKRTSAYAQKVDSLLLELKLDVPVISYENEEVCFLGIKSLLSESNLGISALFGHILPYSMLEGISCEIINLHPSLLPFGRGADPIPWAIINKQKQGVTIHKIDSGLDTGEIVSQRELLIELNLDAGRIYELATDLLFSELKSIFNSWVAGELKGIKQLEPNVIVHKSNDLESLRVIHAQEVGTFEEFLLRLRALTFSDGRKPLFLEDSGSVWEINFSLSPHKAKS